MNSNFSDPFVLYKELWSKNRYGIVKYDNIEDPTKIKILLYKEFKDFEEPRYMIFIDKQTGKIGFYEMAYKKIAEFDISDNNIRLFLERLHSYVHKRE